MECLVPGSRDDVALALHTSGTTRRPKLVPLTHSNLCSGALCIASTLKIQEDDVVLNCLPLFHIHGLAVNVLVPAIAGAMSLCLSGPFDAVTVLKSLHAQPQISLYSAVPTLHHLILTTFNETPDPLASFGSEPPSLRLVRNCSAHLPASLASALSASLHVEVLPTYAMTESMPIASPAVRGREGPHGTVGFAAGPEVKLLRKKNLEDLKEGEEGEICVRGACVFGGYEVREANPNVDAFMDGWFRTGDLAVVSADGLRLTGRCKEIINKAGEKFSPLQIEEVYLQHSLIQDCVAFAAPCEKRGEAIGLAIEIGERNEEDFASCNLDALRMFGRRTQELRLAALPDCVIWMRSLLRTATGKKLRVALAERLGLPKLRGDHGEWFATGEGHEVSFRPAERFARFGQSEDLGIRSMVREVAKEIVRGDFEDDEALMDIGIDSLSATTLINKLESQLDVSLTGHGYWFVDDF